MEDEPGSERHGAKHFRLLRVMAGHRGWVNALATDPGRNAWLASGGADDCVRLWDMATGASLGLLRSPAPVHALCAAPVGQPYLFSGGDDCDVRCWDLEAGAAVRVLHGHGAGVSGVATHPAMASVLLSASLDGTVRVWDVRVRAAAHVLVGHRGAVLAVAAMATAPHVASAGAGLTGAEGGVVRLWDLAAGTCTAELAHAGRSLRALAAHPAQRTFAAGGADARVLRYVHPEGVLVGAWPLVPLPAPQDDGGEAYLARPHDSMRIPERKVRPPAASGSKSAPRLLESTPPVVNGLAVSADGLLAAACEDGGLRLFDWDSHAALRTLAAPVQPGSVASEAALRCAVFDASGVRLFTGQADKTIKVWGVPLS